MHRIRCPRLFALVGLWRMAHTLWDWQPAVQSSAAHLDAIGASWAEVCREASDLLRKAGPDAVFSNG